MVTTPGFDAQIRYILETVPGTTPTNPALLLFSRETTVAALGVDMNATDSMDIGNVDVEDQFTAKTVYTIKVEGHIYDASRILDFMIRNADGSVKSYTLEYLADASDTVKHYYTCTGWRAKKVEIKTAVGEPWAFTIEFVAGLIADPVTTAPAIGTGSREAKSAIIEAIKLFSTAAVTLDGSAFAAICGSFNLSVENTVENKYTIGSASPVVTVAMGGSRKVTGSADISFDDGASAVWARVKAFATHSIVIPFGAPASGEPKLTVAGVRFPKLEITSDTKNELLMGGQDFQAAISTGTLTVGTA